MENRQDTLDELGNRLRESDRAAFAEIFRRLNEPLVRYARRITKDEAAAYDVLQDVFLKLWEARHTITIRVSLQTMLYTMVHNRALNTLRRRKWISKDVAVEEMYDAKDAGPAGDEVVAAEELREHVRLWLSELPDRRAEAFALSRYHGLQHSEIAAIMGVSTRTVDTHILLALRHLRGRLEALQQQRL